MREDHKKQHHGRFMEGFFWGAVIGGATAYVLSHKKGRDFLKEIIQDGIDFLEEKSQSKVEEEVFEENVPVSRPQEEVVPVVSDAAVEVAMKEEVAQQDEISKPKPKKRFFKNAKK